MSKEFWKINNLKHCIDIRGIKSDTVIIVIHGGPGGNNYVFEETAGKLLEQYYTVLYYDQRGCGLSERPTDELDYKLPTLVDDLHKIIQRLKYEKIYLLGYSFGGQLALELSEWIPDKRL